MIGRTAVRPIFFPRQLERFRQLEARFFGRTTRAPGNQDCNMSCQTFRLYSASVADVVERRRPCPSVIFIGTGCPHQERHKSASVGSLSPSRRSARSRNHVPPSRQRACAKGPVSDIPESIRQFVDEPDGVTRYIDKSTSDRLNEDAFYLYVVRKGCDVWLRVRAQYLSEKPLNVVRLLIKADGKTFELNEPRFQRDSDGKFTWQWVDDRVSVDHLVMLFTISASKSAVVHFVGANRTEERVIGDQEKAALKAMLNTYQALGGQL